MTEKLAAEIVAKSGGIMRDTGMTSAAPKPSAGEQAGSRTPLVDAIIKKFPHSAQLEELARDLEAERELLRERLNRIKAELSRIDPAELTKAERNILNHVASS